MIAGEPFMKLKLVGAISALAIPALAYAQQTGPPPKVPKPTKADVQNIVQMVANDKARTQAYCDLNKLYAQVEDRQQKNDFDAVEALTKRADALVTKLGAEYSRMVEGLDQVDLTSTEGKEIMSILLELDKLCTQ